VVCSTWYPQFLRCSCSPASPYQVRYYSCYCNVLPKPKLCTNFEVAKSTIAERSRGPKFFRCCLAQTPTSFCTKSCFFVSYCPSPSCIANLNLLASMTAKINTGVPIFNFFLDAPLARTPANCGPKSCFLVSYTPSPTCIPNLKLLASMIAEINRGSQIFWILP